MVGICVVVALAVGCAAHEPAAQGRPADVALPEAAPTAPGVLVHVYDCADGERLVTRGAGREQLELHRDGDELAMESVPADGDLAYQGEGVSWEVVGGEGRLTLGDGTRVRCGESPGAVVWEEARLRGVEYRAQGYDHSWELEVKDGALTFRAREREGSLNADRVIWTDDGAQLRAETADANVRVEMLDLECDNADAGLGLEQVRVTVNDRLLEGCGRAM